MLAEAALSMRLAVSSAAGRPMALSCALAVMSAEVLREAAVPTVGVVAPN